jgi:hypothetical protein
MTRVSPPVPPVPVPPPTRYSDRPLISRPVSAVRLIDEMMASKFELVVPVTEKVKWSAKVAPLLFMAKVSPKKPLPSVRSRTCGVVPMVCLAMTADDPNVAVANTIPAIRDFFISYLAKKQPRPAAWFFKNRGTSSYQTVSKTREKRHKVCASPREKCMNSIISARIWFYPSS